MRTEKGLGDGLGRLAGALSYAGSAARGVRIFHPEGELYAARVDAEFGVAPGVENFSQRLAGTALVRLSAALWTGQHEWPDILGAAIRFGWNPEFPLRVEGTQDLLMITAKRFWTLPLSFFVTEVSDFLDNVYYSILPFVTDAGEREFRIVPQPGSRAAGKTRSERLANAVAQGDAVFTLQSRPTAAASGSGHSPPWRSVARIQLLERVAVDDRKLLFTPFQAARGIEPSGLANRVRRLAYEASRAGRAPRD